MFKIGDEVIVIKEDKGFEHFIGFIGIIKDARNGMQDKIYVVSDGEKEDNFFAYKLALSDNKKFNDKFEEYLV